MTSIGATIADFQSTLLQEERHLVDLEQVGNWAFQSTLLQEERRGISTVDASLNIFQSTLLQEERPFHGAGSKEF